jgi:SAM-dependent methyltransferase
MTWLKKFFAGRRLPGRTSQSISSSGPNEIIVRTLYRAVLRREPDPGGMARYLQYLNSGHSVLQAVKKLSDSEEFRAGVGTPTPTNSVRELTQKIRQAQLERETYDAFGSKALAELYKFDERFAASQEKYLDLHRNRFYEIDCAVANLFNMNPGNASILDFGYSINSHVLLEAIPNGNVSMADRPGIIARTGKFHSLLSVDLADDGLDNHDWGVRFDIIVFSEVIEHVMVHPVRILKFLLKHLEPGGCVVLTTPNVFSRGRLDRIRQRRSPLPPYPLEYTQRDAPHFHIREYSMSDMLEMIEAAGGKSRAFFFSACWDEDAGKHIPVEEFGNLFIVFGKA